MKRFSKAILISVGVLIALLVAALVGVNLYLQSPGVTARIQEELSRALRMPLRITNTSFTPWSDLRITGITIPNGETNLLEAASFNARYRLAPLLDRKLVIHQVTVDSPKIVWAQNEEGKWTLPQPEEAAAVSAAHPPTDEAPPSTPETTAAPTQPEAPAEPKEKPAKAKRDLEVIVESGKIKRGIIELRDKANLTIATFTDVTLTFTKLTPEHIEGTAEIGRAAWENYVVLETVKTPFSYVDGTLSLPGLDARLGGGFLKADLSWAAKGDRPTFRSTLDFEHVDLARLGADAGWAEGDAAGTLRGTFALAGSTDEWQRAEGNAALFLRNGRFRNNPYFEIIGLAFQNKDLADLRLNESKATLRFADEKAFIESLSLDAPDLLLTASGLIRIDGKLQIAARLTPRERVLRQLPSRAVEQFALAEDQSRYVDFTITGKTSKPKTDLLEKFLGQKFDLQFDELLSRIWPGSKKKDEPKKKDDKKKKKKDEPKEEALEPVQGAIEAP